LLFGEWRIFYDNSLFFSGFTVNVSGDLLNLGINLIGFLVETK
jgi:hypothetical protein